MSTRYHSGYQLIYRATRPVDDLNYPGQTWPVIGPTQVTDFGVDRHNACALFGHGIGLEKIYDVGGPDSDHDPRPAISPGIFRAIVHTAHRSYQRKASPSSAHKDIKNLMASTYAGISREYRRHLRSGAGAQKLYEAASGLDHYGVRVLFGPKITSLVHLQWRLVATQILVDKIDPVTIAPHIAALQDLWSNYEMLIEQISQLPGDVSAHTAHLDLEAVDQAANRLLTAVEDLRAQIQRCDKPAAPATPTPVDERDTDDPTTQLAEQVSRMVRQRLGEITPGHTTEPAQADA